MTVELGSWYFNILYAGVAAIVIAVIFVIAWRKKGQYEKEASGNILCIIKRDTGWDLMKVVTPFSDGYVRVGRGDYKLPVGGKDFLPEELPDGYPLDDEGNPLPKAQLSVEDRLKFYNERHLEPSAFRWRRYPTTPFLGLKALQVPIRAAEWWENDPRPITKRGDREPEVTAAELQAHTRQLDAQNLGIKIHEGEERERRFMQVFSSLCNKYIVYIGLGAILIGVVISIVMQGQGLAIGG